MSFENDHFVPEIEPNEVPVIPDSSDFSNDESQQAIPVLASAPGMDDQDELVLNEMQGYQRALGKLGSLDFADL